MWWDATRQREIDGRVHVHVNGDRPGNQDCVERPVVEDCAGVPIDFCSNPPAEPIPGDGFCSSTTENFENAPTDCYYATALSAASPPSTPASPFGLCAGESALFTLEFENAGTLPWINEHNGVEGSDYVELHSVDSAGNPVDNDVLFPGIPPWINRQRVGPPLEDTAEPGDIATFTFQVRVPDDGSVSPGTYTSFFRPFSATGGFIDDWGGASFTVRVANCAPLSAPNPPALNSPPDGANVFTGSTNFAWGTSPGANRYHLTVCTSPDLTTGCLNPGATIDGFEPEPGITSQAVAINAPGQYFWSVRAITADESLGWGGFAPARALTVNEAPLEASCPADAQCGSRECGLDPICRQVSCGACDSPPPDECAPDGATLRRIAWSECRSGFCEYYWETVPCSFGCAGGACVGCTPDCAGRECGSDACGNPCGPPSACDGTPPSECFDAARMTVYQLNSGRCENGQCVWTSSVVACEFGCTNGSCCTPACGTRECGPDPNGCNVSCGSGCDPLTEACVDGTCVCQPTCAARGADCGDDGCGNPNGCGTCGGANEQCNLATGQCQCTLTCPAGAQCGTDGCGRSCGACAPGDACLGNNCFCVQQCGGVTCGDDGCGNPTGCGACPAGYACDLGQCICQPDCAGRVCGADGCGNADGCGTCSGTDACETATGQCVPTCAPDCLAKECGDDGCGLADGCGTCGANATCTVDGLCSQWSATAITGAPAARTGHVAAWTGSELIVWGGLNKNTGGRFTPSTNTWVTTTTTGAPLRRDYFAGVWTGSRLLVFGGVNSGAGHLNDGGSYNPSSDSWTALSTTGAPTPRRFPGAVWTGSLMLVWGGRNDATGFRDGGEYDPSTNAWTAIPGVFDVSSGRSQPAAVWTGSRMLVWGGENIGTGGTFPNTGALYNPTNNSWGLTSTTNAPAGRFFMAFAWTGTELIVWGGTGDAGFLGDGGRYNPATDTWTPMTSVNAPAARSKVSGDWIGAPVNRFVVWGGLGPPGNVFFDDGAAYDPATDTWTPLDGVGAPSVRHSASVTSIGTEFIVWGGEGPGGVFLGDGGMYRP